MLRTADATWLYRRPLRQPGFVKPLASISVLCNCIPKSYRQEHNSFQATLPLLTWLTSSCNRQSILCQGKGQVWTMIFLFTYIQSITLQVQFIAFYIFLRNMHVRCLLDTDRFVLTLNKIGRNLYLPCILIRIFQTVLFTIL